MHTYFVGESCVFVHNSRRCPTQLKKVVGLSDDGIEFAIKNRSRLQHAYKHAKDLGFGNWNKKAEEQWKDYIRSILDSPIKSFDNTLGADPVKGFYKVVDNNHVAVYIYKKGENAGQVASVIKLSMNQLQKFNLK